MTKIPSNPEILKQMEASRNAGSITPELMATFQTIIKHVIHRPSYREFTYRGDMEQKALEQLVKSALKFNPIKSQNPFAFFRTDSRMFRPLRYISAS